MPFAPRSSLRSPHQFLLPHAAYPQLMGNKDSTPTAPEGGERGDEPNIPVVPAEVRASSPANNPPVAVAEVGVAPLLIQTELQRGGVPPDACANHDGHTPEQEQEVPVKEELADGKAKEETSARETILSMLGRGTAGTLASASTTQPSMPPPPPLPLEARHHPPAPTPAASGRAPVQAISISELESRVGSSKAVEGGKGIGRGTGSGDSAGTQGGQEPAERGKQLISMLSQANQKGGGSRSEGAPSEGLGEAVGQRNRSKEAALKGMLFGGEKPREGDGKPINPARAPKGKREEGKGPRGSEGRRRGRKGTEAGAPSPQPPAAAPASTGAFAWSSFQRSPDPKTIPLPPAVFKGPGLTLEEEAAGEGGREGLASGGAGDATQDLKKLLKLG